MSSILTLCLRWTATSPIRAKCSDSRYSLMEFMREFPDDATCLPPVVDVHRLRPSRPPDGRDDLPQVVHVAAPVVLLHVADGEHPLRPLREAARTQVGVSYRTAWRMLNKIRNYLMEQDGPPLEGDVEVDETAYGGKPRASHRGEGHVRKTFKPTVWGAVEPGGRIKVMVVKSRGTIDVETPIFTHVLPSSMIFTDEWGGYTARVGSRYIAHRRIRHEDRVYVSGDVHTQTIEGFFGNLKNGIRGTYHSVSSKWLQSYLDDHAWRYCHRHQNERSMFESLLIKAAD